MTMAIIAATVWFIPGWLRTAEPREGKIDGVWEKSQALKDSGEARWFYGRIAILRRIVYTTIYFVEYRRCI